MLALKLNYTETSTSLKIFYLALLRVGLLKNVAKAKETLPILNDIFYTERNLDSLDNLPLHDIIKEPLKDITWCLCFHKSLHLVVDEMHNMTKHFAFEPNQEER